MTTMMTSCSSSTVPLTESHHHHDDVDHHHVVVADQPNIVESQEEDIESGTPAKTSLCPASSTETKNTFRKVAKDIEMDHTGQTCREISNVSSVWPSLSGGSSEEDDDDEEEETGCPRSYKKNQRNHKKDKSHEKHEGLDDYDHGDAENHPEPNEKINKKDDASETENKSSPRQGFQKLFTEKYSKEECYYVIAAGICLSFNSGYINGACLSGFLTPHAFTQSVAGFTGAYTDAALSLAVGDYQYFAFELWMILSFIAGSFIAGLLTPDGTPYRIEPSYGPTFLIGGVFLLVSSILAALEHDESYFFFCAAAANGIQNGVSSTYSSNLIRTTHLTGTSTDIGLFIGQAIRGNYDNVYKLALLVVIASSFWLGGLVSFFATIHFTSFSLLFNAGLFLFIGFSLIIFLVKELHITVSAAILGTWQWKRALDRLHSSFVMESSLHSSSRIMTRHLSPNFNAFLGLFDRLDSSGSGVIGEDDLLRALQESGLSLKRCDIKSMMKRVNKHKNGGKITREEWIQIAAKYGKDILEEDASFNQN